jgi:hypothetical protein
MGEYMIKTKLEDLGFIYGTTYDIHVGNGIIEKTIFIGYKHYKGKRYYGIETQPVFINTDLNNIKCYSAVVVNDIFNKQVFPITLKELPLNIKEVNYARKLIGKYQQD